MEQEKKSSGRSKKLTQVRISDLKKVIPVDTVLQLQKKIISLQVGADEQLYEALCEVEKLHMALEVLEETQFGKLIYKLTKHKNERAAAKANAIFVKWKEAAITAWDRRQRREKMRLLDPKSRGAGMIGSSDASRITVVKDDSDSDEPTSGNKRTNSGGLRQERLSFFAGGSQARKDGEDFTTKLRREAEEHPDEYNALKETPQSKEAPSKKSKGERNSASGTATSAKSSATTAKKQSVPFLVRGPVSISEDLEEMEDAAVRGVQRRMELRAMHEVRQSTSEPSCHQDLRVSRSSSSAAPPSDLKRPREASWDLEDGRDDEEEDFSGDFPTRTRGGQSTDTHSSLGTTKKTEANRAPASATFSSMRENLQGKHASTSSTPLASATNPANAFSSKIDTSRSSLPIDVEAACFPDTNPTTDPGRQSHSASGPMRPTLSLEKVRASADPLSHPFASTGTKPSSSLNHTSNSKHKGFGPSPPPLVYIPGISTTPILRKGPSNPSGGDQDADNVQPVHTISQ